MAGALGWGGGGHSYPVVVRLVRGGGPALVRDRGRLSYGATVRARTEAMVGAQGSGQHTYATVLGPLTERRSAPK